MQAFNTLAPPVELSVGQRYATAGLAALQRTVESLAALLVLADVAVLLFGVLARYVFHKPVTWSDELASALFLWLAMLGAVIALQRGEHMRLTTFVERVPPSWRGPVDAIASMTSLAFLAVVAWPAREYFVDEQPVMTPALGFSNSWRVLALAVGISLMAAIAFMRLLERGNAKSSVIALAVVGVVSTTLWAASPFLISMGNANLLIFFVGIVAVAVALGTPIAFAFGIATVTYLSFVTDVPLSVVVSRMDEGMSHIILLAVPLFVFLGSLLVLTGMAQAMVTALASLLGRVQGGMAYVLLGAMYLVSGISGSKAADMAAVAPVLFPEMKRRGSKPGELVSLLAASGAMTETIPPSLVLITVGSVAGVSIASLFTGGLLPALLLALILAVVTFFRMPKEDLSGFEKLSARKIAMLFAIASPSLALPFFIRAAVVEGVATATEVSTLGIVYVVLVGILVHRKFDIRKLYPILVDTAALSGAILLIIGTATAMAWALTQAGFSSQLAEAMSRVPGGKWGFMAISILIFMLLGSVLEGIPAMVLLGPLLFPIARAVGINDVHYSIVAILAMGIGLFAPPFGVGYYTACAVANVAPGEGLSSIWIYLAALLVGVVLIAAVPWFSTGFL